MVDQCNKSGTSGFTLSKIQIQSVLFRKKNFKSNSQVKKISKKHGWKASKVETKPTWNWRRVRQQSPSKFKKSTFRTISGGRGIKFVVGQRK